MSRWSNSFVGVSIAFVCAAACGQGSEEPASPRMSVSGSGGLAVGGAGERTSGSGGAAAGVRGGAGGSDTSSRGARGGTFGTTADCPLPEPECTIPGDPLPPSGTCTEGNVCTVWRYDNPLQPCIPVERKDEYRCCRGNWTGEPECPRSACDATDGPITGKAGAGGEGGEGGEGGAPVESCVIASDEIIPDNYPQECELIAGCTEGTFDIVCYAEPSCSVDGRVPSLCHCELDTPTRIGWRTDWDLPAFRGDEPDLCPGALEECRASIPPQQTD